MVVDWVLWVGDVLSRKVKGYDALDDLSPAGDKFSQKPAPAARTFYTSQPISEYDPPR